ncbi:rna-binding protein [Salix suchowensis]|nr:rna-binding protein [Salix suchowensis]
MPHYSPQVGHWGNRFQSLPLSSPSSSPVTQTPPVNVGDAESDASSGREGEQSCNNPTIFVGSLPTNTDEKELRFSLQVHLTQYAKVMYVKIHHGKDGGICAFVQFENVDSAAVFLDTLRANSQRLFLGRRLRFEIAHAHRTLLVSYRVPNMQDTVSVSSESHDLPFSMTIRKNASPPVVFNEIASEESLHGVSGLHFQPVICTAEVIHQLATHFGPLERLELYKQASSGHVTWAHHRAQQSDPLRSAVLAGPHNDDQPSDGIKGDTSPSPANKEESFDWSTDAPSEGHLFSANRLNVEDDESTPRAIIAPLVPSKPQVQGAKNDAPNGVGTSPVSPNESEFPSIPSSAEPLLGFPNWHDNNPRMGCGFEEGFSQRDFDRSALYIPNILVHGPEAWSEYKLEDYFSTFGRIKDVKVIRPRTSFQFHDHPVGSNTSQRMPRLGKVRSYSIPPRQSRWQRQRQRRKGVRAYMSNYRRFDGYRRDDRDPSAPPHDFGGVQCVASDALIPNIAALNISTDAESPDASLNVEVDDHREPAAILQANRSQIPPRRLHRPKAKGLPPLAVYLHSNRRTLGSTPDASYAVWHAVLFWIPRGPPGPAGPHSDANSAPYPTPYWPGIYGPFISHPTYSQQRDHTDAGQPVYPSPPVPPSATFKTNIEANPVLPSRSVESIHDSIFPDEQTPPIAKQIGSLARPRRKLSLDTHRLDTPRLGPTSPPWRRIHINPLDLNRVDDRGLLPWQVANAEMQFSRRALVIRTIIHGSI